MQSWIRLKRAACQGDDQAQFNLGRLLEASGVSQEALSWFHKAGKQGNLLAQAELGITITQVSMMIRLSNGSVWPPSMTTAQLNIISD